MPDPPLFTLVTGASSGIGRAATIQLSSQRCLILHGRNVERLEQTRQMCQQPENHVLWPFDLRACEDLAASLMPLLASAGRAVSAFVHCAGTVRPLPARSVNHVIAREVMNINFFSAAEIISVLLKKKTNAQKLTDIVFISSIWSTFGSRGHSVYCASKSALDGFMRALAVELAPNIRVNSILPGAIKTAMAEDGFSDPGIVDRLRQDYPLGTGLPENIADAIQFVLSDKARWITGQQLVVDGGRTINMSLKSLAP